MPKHEEPHALVRSLFDRGLLAASSYAALLDAVRELGAARLLPEEVRPKNAYNLVRLLHSCAHWIVEGTPLITVTGPLRDQLLDIKLSRISLDETMDRARLAADHVDALLQSTKSPLPTEPDVVAADNILRQARRDAARTVFSLSVGVAAVLPAETPALLPERHSDRFVCRFAPTPLPLDIDLKALREFLSDKAKKLPGPFLVVGLTGAHAYGFPSPDSDLDLKAIHAATAKSLLSLSPKTDPLELVEDWRGREMDLSSHELHQAAQLLLKGNGNMLERLLGPCVVLRSPAGEELTSLAQKTLSRRVVHHYRGFFERMLSEHEKLKTTTGSTAKKLLYAYRVALTGAHLLAAGELITDVRMLAPRHGFDVAVLLEQKKNRETAPMVDDSFFAADVVRLRALLDASLKNSVLPEHPDERAVAALDEFVGDTGIEVGTRVGVGVGVVDG